MNIVLKHFSSVFADFVSVFLVTPTKQVNFVHTTYKPAHIHTYTHACVNACTERHIHPHTYSYTQAYATNIQTCSYLLMQKGNKNIQTSCYKIIYQMNKPRME